MVIDMPNRTLTLGQRTKDKVARDILRDEAELPPPMRGIVGLQNGGGPEGQIIFPPARTGGIGDLGRGIVGGIREFGGSIADKWRESRDAAREWGARHGRRCLRGHQLRRLLKINCTIL